MPNMDKRSDFEKKYGLNKPKKKVVAKKAAAKKPMAKETAAKPVRKASVSGNAAVSKAGGMQRREMSRTRLVQQGVRATAKKKAAKMERNKYKGFTWGRDTE